MKELHVSWFDMVNEIPLCGTMLMLRQQQAMRVENVMTLGDKEMLDEIGRGGK